MATSTSANSNLLSYTQYVTALILAAEGSFTAPQSGQTKLTSVLSAIQAASMIGLVFAPSQTVASWTALIGGIVGAFNASGIFGKTSAPALGTAPASAPTA